MHPLLNQATTEITAIRSAAEASSLSADQLREQLLGKNGVLTQIQKGLGALSPEERAEVGPELQLLRLQIDAELTTREEVGTITELHIDRTLPGSGAAAGSVHPITAMMDEMVGIFSRLGFEVVDGPELVQDSQNFTALNLGPDHPARDGHDTFYVTDELVLRTQMTTLQPLELARRVKEEHLPVRIVMPGRTYRRESDATHAAMFHQMDAVLLDQQATFADLKGILTYFVQQLFGDDVETRFRPHHFPFTEPSAELDIKLKNPRGNAPTGWIEFGGCGMIHPAIIERAGLNPRVWRGWAFGMGVERPIMIRHGIRDLRVLTANPPTLFEQLGSLSS